MSEETDAPAAPVKLNKKGGHLTPKMLSFIDAYMECMNANEAMRRSGYTTKNPKEMAAQLMGHPLVVAEIKKRLNARSEKAEIRADWLINKLVQIIEDTQTENPQAALRAIELAGKSIALWKERQEISGPDGEAIRHEQTIKENAADFTRRISSLVERGSKGNVVEFPERGREGSA